MLNFKKLIYSAVLAFSLSTSAQAGTFTADPYLDYAVTGQVADVGITAGMLSTGKFVEGNPFGVALFLLKPALIVHANSLEGEQRNAFLHAVGATGWAAFWHNVAVLAGASTGASVVVLVGTLLYGLNQYEPAPMQEIAPTE